MAYDRGSSQKKVSFPSGWGASDPINLKFWGFIDFESMNPPAKFCCRSSVRSWATANQNREVLFLSIQKGQNEKKILSLLPLASTDGWRWTRNMFSYDVGTYAASGAKRPAKKDENKISRFRLSLSPATSVGTNARFSLSSSTIRQCMSVGGARGIFRVPLPLFHRKKGRWRIGRPETGLLNFESL